MTTSRLALSVVTSLFVSLPSVVAVQQATFNDGFFEYKVTRFDGPGTFCASDFVLTLGPDDRVALLDPGMDFWKYLIDIEEKKVGASTSISVAKGEVVRRTDRQLLRKDVEDGRTRYSLSHNISPSTHFSSRSFLGWDADQWFFEKMALASEAANDLDCIEGKSVKDVEELQP